MGIREVTEEAEAIRRSVEAIIPAALRERMARGGFGLSVSAGSVPGLVYVDPLLPDHLAEEEITAEMVAYRKNVTGVDNTIFISTKVPRHVPRIKVAVDPPTHISRSGDNASVAIKDGTVLAGELPTKVCQQVKAFLDLNRDALLAYWDEQIDGEDLRLRLARVPE